MIIKQSNVAIGFCCALSLILSSCSTQKTADLVVFGKIYTSNTKCEEVRAFAVEDGKYVYIGDSANAAKFIRQGSTVVVNHPSGLVLPGCTEGHGHYITDAMFKQLCYLKSASFEDCLAEIKEYYKSHPGIKQLWGYGWYEANFDEEKDLPRMREELDRIAPDIPVFICDREMHQGWVNSVALSKAGILNGDKVSADTEVVRGGTVYRDPKTGVATGRVQDQACAFVRSKSLLPLLDDDNCRVAASNAQKTLLSLGYTNYLDAWLNYDHSDAIYRVLKAMDDDGDLHMNIVGCYEIDSYLINSRGDYEKEVGTAKSWQQKYTGTHFFPNAVKLFADGCTESYKGYVKNPYPATGTRGTRNWEPSLLNDVVKYINQQGLTVHTHAYGDAAVEEVVDAYVNSVKDVKPADRPRNTVGHAASVDDPEMKRIRDYGIGVAENFCWHSYDNFDAPQLSVEQCNEYLFKAFGKDFFNAMYPMKRFFDYGIPVSSSTDAPCSAGYPASPFGIMEIMITAVNPLYYCRIPRNPASCTTIRQAIQAFTINGAWQLGIEKERGSIEVGKFADFILIDKDILTCPKTDVHNANLESVYFEGNKL